MAIINLECHNRFLTPILHKCRKKLKISVLVGTAITAKVGIKMQALNLCVISAACFSTFYGSPY